MAVVSPGESEPGRRLDIQGLRGVAVIAVLLFHAKIPGFSGGFVGVDVFFVISGYLISGILLRELRSTGTIRLSSFYARRIRRILPAAATVIVATVVLTALLLPVSRWSDAASDAVASSLYWVNWSLADRSVDYLAQDAAASPLQHYWSLAIEEQYYLLWPALLLAVTWAVRIAARSAPLHPRRRLAAVQLAPLAAALGVLLLSLAWSVHTTAATPGAAYFLTTTRVWEVAVGATLALLPARARRLPRPAAVLVGWVGLAAVVFAVLAYSSSLAYPGMLALVPTLGAAAMILAGSTAGPAGPAALLSLRPLTWAGDLSYSLYLWHWPLLVVATALFEGLSPAVGLAVVMLAVAPAWLSWRYVERPAQVSRSLANSKVRTFKVGILVTLVALLAGLLLHVSLFPEVPPPPYSPALVRPGQTAAGGPTRELWGAEVLAVDPGAGDPTDDVTFFTPSVQSAYQDNPSVYAQGCHLDKFKDEAKLCEYRYGRGSLRVAIAGDSHAAQWVPALRLAARDRGWILDSYTKSSCPVVNGDVLDQQGRPYASCTRWNRNLRQALAERKPDLLLVSSFGYSMAAAGSGRGTSANAAERYAKAQRAAYRGIARAGIPVVVIRDTPHVGLDIPECVARHRGELTRCAVDRAVALRKNGTSGSAVAGLSRVWMVDLTPQICPAPRCAPIIGRVLVYRDAHHLTATYARTLSGFLVSDLERIPGLGLR
nr:acyltransferase family protein [Microlunatus panaciterrae]